MSSHLAIRSARFSKLLIVAGLFVMLAGAMIPIQNASAAEDPAVEEPDAAGTFNTLQIAQDNTFRVYAKAGETINFKVLVGYGTGSAASSCANISIRQADNMVVGGATIDYVRQDGKSVTVTSSALASTCSSAPNPHRWISLKYTVPSNTSFNSMSSAYKLFFDAPGSDNKTVDRSYKWQITVTNSVGIRQYGRAWLEGNDSGLKVYQDYAWTNGDNNSTDNKTNHSFRFVRADGYRYTVNYKNYQGIWSVFHGGLYGGRFCGGITDYLKGTASAYSTCTTLGLPAYLSYSEGQGIETRKYAIDDSTGNNWRHTTDTYTYATNNIAYIFVDCGLQTNCPEDIPDSILKKNPVTTLNSQQTDGSGNTYTPEGAENSPIADANNDAATEPNPTGFRYVGYSATNLTKGKDASTIPKVIIPYMAMQTGYIRLTVTAKISGISSTLCQRDILVDDPDGAGTVEWFMQKDSLCLVGTTLQGADAPVIDPTKDDMLTITAQGIHLGEMHFIDVDTEYRGGILIEGNGLGSPEQRRQIIWNDPFDRKAEYTCGLISPLSGSGSPSAVNSGIGSVSSATGTGAGRGGINSYENTNGVHGWTYDKNDACDGNGSGENDGSANADGTATTASTWGNNRVIEDWTYEFEPSPVRTITLGGPNYTLLPSVKPSPAAIAPSQTVTANPQVKHQGATKAENVSWQLSRLFVPAGASLGSGRTGSAASIPDNYSCDYYEATSGVVCDMVKKGTKTFDNNETTMFTGDDNYTETDTQNLAVGSKVCFVLLVSPYTQAGGNFQEAISCVTVAASPYVSVVGGSVWAGGSTDVTNNYAGPGVKITGKASGSVFGSFGEYGVFATGQISSFGSAGHVGLTAPASGKGAQLTFGSIGSLGVFSNSHQIVNLAAQYSSAPHTETVLSNAPGGKAVNASGVYRVSSDITVMSISSGKNPRAVIYAPENTVTIAGDLRYTYAGATSFKELPSLTIIAKKIIIADGVGEIAGNYYATEQFVTCSNGPITKGASGAISAAGACSKSLVINGTVTVANQAAGSLVLNRSYGGTTTGQPAEVIKMRPESVLTPYENSLTFTTVYETELPARY